MRTRCVSGCQYANRQLTCDLLLMYEKNQQPKSRAKPNQAEASNLSHHHFFNSKEVAISTAVHKANCP